MKESNPGSMLWHLVLLVFRNAGRILRRREKKRNRYVKK